MTEAVDRRELIAQLRPYAERAKELKGFRLEFEPTPLGPPMPWDYQGLARQLVARARSLLDFDVVRDIDALLRLETGSAAP